MSPHDRSPSGEFVRLARVASEARDLTTLVGAEHQMRIGMRRALVSCNWSDLDEAQDKLMDSPSLAARFNASLHHVLETPELAAVGRGAYWHGLVLAIPVTLASREGALVPLAHPLASALRESLQEQFPHGTGIRLISRLIPQLVVHSMRTRSLYELVEELASGEDGMEAGRDAHPGIEFAPRSGLGRHYLFALAFTAHPEQFALEMPGDLRREPALVKWAADQTEKITNDFAERGWHLEMRVSVPQRLREMLSLPPELSDVREVDALLDHVASQHGTPITMLRADLSLRRREEAALQITISERRVGRPLSRSVYRLAPLGLEALAYRVAVRLASAGVELAAAEDTLRRAVERAITLTNAAPASETTAPHALPASHALGTRALWSRITRSLRHPT